MNKYISKSILAVIAGSFAMTGCTGSFDEVNTDPDRPSASQVESTNTLAYCERYASDNMFDEWFDLNESCGFSGQVAKWMYTEEGYYDYRTGVNDNSWYYTYLTASNLQAIIDKETEGSNMWAAATIFQCQIFQVISDRWGNVPYTEAFKLEDGVTKPAYDKQSYIYPDLLKRLKAAVEALDEDGDDLGKGDVLLNGDITAWKKYGNALRLRIAARLANIDETDAKATFEEILGNTEKYPIPESNDDNVFFNWTNEYSEPWAAYYQSRQQEYGISKLMVETLKNSNDPRLDVYACPTTDYTNGNSTEKYVGYQNGMEAQANVSANSLIGDRFQAKDNLKGFSPWLRSCETYFAISYAASKGWNVGMTQQQAYEKAVKLSIEENDCDATDFLANAGAYNGTQEQLFTQWWVSVFKNGMEAWSVYRMSGYPSGNVIAPGYTKKDDHNCPPLSYPYPVSEINLNTANCNAEAAAQVDEFWGKQMWWDTRSGLK